ncbi:prepilin-type N-terminal cleavage/methylation domain-containing protein [Pseudomonas citronellolis]|uniref:prepilin-type N-terminal cleavage/methylation domain-containing protein n=1 Tax=Pseudomonas citronellolis TaxID=53408 RepID=UPI000718A9EC|nr:prepilin-type N-terminal cleavage/methylation domain-containing protein [Pseudomonas citronellolis]KRV81737.1 type II secretion system protein [Pseudomonas citronellolis]KRW77248.1 type II secretion system protein [Pseudomonas citronellolis]
MRTSASCPGNERYGGFTLLELLVVLALVAAVGAVVMPNLLNMQEAWRRRVDLQDIANQLQTLGYRARLEARQTLIGPAGVEPPQMLKLPQGWTLSASAPVIYLANGVCLGGTLELRQGDVARQLQLVPPQCLPEFVQ